MKKSLFKLIVGFTFFSSFINAQYIYTYAGTGLMGFSGDGGAATGAKLNNPSGVVVDTSGNVYIADWVNQRIRKINTSGIISTFAGTGTAGYSGDGGAADLAQLCNPEGIAIDAAGNIYIADYSNNRIRKVNTSGIISTFAGTGVGGFAGDGGAAVNAQLLNPNGVAIDALGNVYIADYNNHRIRKVNTSGVISTFAGTGVPGFSGDGANATNAQLKWPIGVAVDATDNVYISDYVNHSIRKVNTSGIISTFAGTGVAGYNGDGTAAINAQLNFPVGVAFDTSSNTYISEAGGQRIRKVNSSGVISTFAGTGVAGYSGDGGVAGSAQLNVPAGIAFDLSGNLYISDYDNNRIRKICGANCITNINSFIESADELLIYPNPGSVFNLNYKSSEQRAVLLKIHNILGECIYSKSYENFKGELTEIIDLNKYQKGIYVLQILNGQTKFYRALIVE